MVLAGLATHSIEQLATGLANDKESSVNSQPNQLYEPHARQVAKRPFFKTLRGRIVLTVFLTVALPLLLSISVVNARSPLMIDQQVKADLGILAHNMTREINSAIDQRQRDLEAMAAQGSVANLLKDPIVAREASAQLVALQGHNAEELFLANADGQITATSSENTETRVQADAWTAISQGKPGIAVFRDVRRSQVFLQFVQPVPTNGSQQILGYIGTNIAITSILYPLDDYQTSARAQQAYLVDVQGRFITQPQLSKEQLVFSSMPSTDGLKQAQAGIAGTGRYRDYRGRDVLGSYSPLGKTGWALFVEQDRRTVQDPVWLTAALLTSVMALAMVLGGVVAWRVGYQLEKPIRLGVHTVDDAVHQLGASANEQATGAQEQASSVSEVTATMDELSRTAEQIAQNAEETLAHAEKGNAAFQETLTSMSTVTERVEATARQILALGEKGQRIGEISRIITEIAERIHLLSLNAAIEAAGAGEYGRRFAVVASQVKELADATRKSSAQVQQLIDEIRNATNSAIMVTEQATKQVEATARITDHAGGAIEEIVQRVEAIALATQQQRTANEQVVATMRQIADVSRQSAQVSSEVAHSAEMLSDTIVSLRRVVSDDKGA
jgi:hypothetical protein